ncbi:MAG TPA: hypothetical protein VHT70_02220 [Candidatus Saccharimonadales bacterium]|jgi:hypothetical protein|nr:hypothetical protein [Candidatus Saccharimonadales bacterium]
MKTLDREETYRLWDQYWHDMQEEWFKIEVMQDYTGEDDSPSLRAWLAGDKDKSLALIQDATHGGWSKRCKEKSDQGVLMRRIRIIEKPYTPYTEWEIEYYKRINIPGGEQVFIVEKRQTVGLDLPSGDMMMFDNSRAVVCSYDETGRMIRQTFYDKNDDTTKFLQLKHDVLPLAQPL